MAQSQSDSTDEPNSELARTIVRVAHEMPDATNGEIADEVEDRFGERPDPSWVSRVRRKYGQTAPTPGVTGSTSEHSPDEVEALLIRMDTLAGRLDRYASAVEALEDRVDELEDDVDDVDEPEVTWETLADRITEDE